ncbi:ParB/RepB/Spo0J family partition protein (plasmid) [Pseudomonas putida]|uniref:ParB/RepB/Spo0J family partition protein n=1 Tax=Pseudomonas putida TaxID=303 RepID=UPI001BB06CA4|nr:ParB/RepB/Spo0J family partition protein [Pseudomonas putida]QUG93255.1 ParB/RepB/Spo0J family partition protein [Pseudomonas putida]
MSQQAVELNNKAPKSPQDKSPQVKARRANPLSGSLLRSAELHREGNEESVINNDAGTKLARSIPVDLIDPSPWQPRRNFNQKSLNELAELIDAQGLLQPIEVRSINNRYQLVSGERRLRAHKILQQRFIQAFVIVITDEEASSRALVENLGRENLTDFEVYLSIKRHFRDFGENSGHEHWGMPKSSYFRLLAFDNFPSAVNDLLADNPDIISSYSADEVKRLISSEVEKGADRSKYDAALKTLVQQAIDGGKKLTNLAAQIYAFLNPNKSLPNKTELKFKGSKAGEITKKTNHTQVKLNHSAFTPEKLDRLEAFIAELLTE